jgi:hypothetical protein
MKRRFATCAIVFAAAVATVAGEGIQTAGAAAILGLDHIPIAVGNLERAADRFRALGFVLKPGRPHANGIRNEHAKFSDGTELELITAPAARDDLTRKYRRHLAAGDGPAFLAFYAPDQSRVTRPLPPYVFLGGRQRSPTDQPEHFAHPNGADSFISVWLAGADLSRERELMRAHGAAFTRQTVRVPEAVTADVARLREGDVVFLPADRQQVKGRPIVGATVRVKSAAAARRVIESAGIAVRVAPGGASAFVAPEAANGLWLEFREIPDAAAPTEIRR